MRAAFTGSRDAFAPTAPGDGCDEHVELADGRVVTLCPVRPADAPDEQRFVGALSAASRYRRFHIGLRQLPPDLLRHLTQVDQQHHVAIVARARGGEQHGRIVADARYVLDDDGERAEFAIAVADEWQRAGLGREMVRRLALVAAEHGVARLVGDVLWDNLPMQRMVRSLGGTLAAVSRNVSVLQASFDLSSGSGAWPSQAGPP